MSHSLETSRPPPRKPFHSHSHSSSSLIKHLLFPRTSPRLTSTNLSRFLSTVSGLDKSFMLIQYPAKLLISLISLLAGTLRGNKRSRRVLVRLAGDLGRLSGTLGDTRTTMRLLGIISLVPSLPTLLDPTPPLTPTLQLVLLLIYYPLENLTHLSSHNIFKLSRERETRWAVWSCRAWAGWVGLEFIELRKRWVGLRVARERQGQMEREVRRGSTMGLSEKPITLGEDDPSTSSPCSTMTTTMTTTRSRTQLRALQTSFLEDLIINLAYAPLTIHWSLYNGLWEDPVWTGLFGTVACLAGIRKGWRGMGEARTSR